MTFPTTLPNISVPSATDYMDSTGLEGDTIIDSIIANVEAIAAKVGVDGSGATGSMDYLGKLYGLPNYTIAHDGTRYTATNLVTGARDFQNASNVGAVINSCSSALVALGHGGIISLRAGILFPTSTKVSLGAGVVLHGGSTMVQDTTQGPTILQASSAIVGGVIELDGNDAAVIGLLVDGNSNSDYGIRMKAQGNVVSDCNISGAKTINLWCDGTSGATRCVMKSVRTQSAVNNGGIGIQINGADHIINNFRVAGAATNGWAAYFSGQHTVASNAHITASGDAAGILKTDNSGNMFSNIMFDTGPDGTNGSYAIQIRSGGNMFSNCLVYNNKGANTSAFGIIKDGAGDYRQRNIFTNIYVDGNNGGGGGTSVSFKYVLSFIDETGAAPAGLGRFAGTSLNTVATNDTATALLNITPSALTVPNAIRIRNCLKVVQSTTVPITMASEDYGSQDTTGDGVATTIVVAHTLGLAPTVVSVTPTNAQMGAAAGWYVSARTATNFTVTFTAALTNLLHYKFDWECHL